MHMNVDIYSMGGKVSYPPPKNGVTWGSKNKILTTFPDGIKPFLGCSQASKTPPGSPSPNFLFSSRAAVPNFFPGNQKFQKLRC